jgi:hypothetical protein
VTACSKALDAKPLAGDELLQVLTDQYYCGSRTTAFFCSLHSRDVTFSLVTTLVTARVFPATVTVCVRSKNAALPVQLVACLQHGRLQNSRRVHLSLDKGLNYILDC